MGDRFNADSGSGFRGGTADFGASATSGQRGSWNSEQNPAADQSQAVLGNSPSSNPHSSAGFRRALERTQRASSRLKDQLPNKTSFGGPGFKKPNYFAQGGKRHGMHIGAGAPYTAGGQDGADTGN